MEEQLANSNSSNSGYSNSNSNSIDNHNNSNVLGLNRSSSKIAKGSKKRSGSGGGGGGVIQSTASNKQKQTSVFKIDKSDFRNAVQRLTGTPSTFDNRNGSSPPPSSRLHKIRPPRLTFSSGGDSGLILPQLPLLTLASPPPPSAFGLTQLGFDGNAISSAMQLPSPSFFSPLPPLTPGDHVWANTPDALLSQRPENLTAPWSANWGDPISSYNRSLPQPWYPVPVPSPAYQFTIPSPLPSPGGLEFPLSPNGLFSPLPTLFPSPTLLFPTGAQTIRRALNDSPTEGLTAGFSFSHGHM
jgi:hypothetical protein